MTQYQRGLCWDQWEVMSIYWTHIVIDIALNNLTLDKNQTTLPTFYYLKSFDIHRRFSLNQTNWMKTFVAYSFLLLRPFNCALLASSSSKTYTNQKRDDYGLCKAIYRWKHKEFFLIPNRIIRTFNFSFIKSFPTFAFAIDIFILTLTSNVVVRDKYFKVYSYRT